MSFKDLYIEELERLASELEDEGMDPDAAYERAGDLAYDTSRDRYADMADQARQRAKDEAQ